MKSEERHRLEQNELADRLAIGIEAVKPHAPLIVGVIIALVVALVGWSLLKRSNATQNAAAWEVFSVAIEGSEPNLDMLSRTAEAYEGEPVAQWSAITYADGKLYQASVQYLTNRAQANESMELAEAEYNKLVDARGVDAKIVDRANFGLGRLYELRGELDKAREHYEKVTGTYSELAKARIETLASDETKSDYDWLETAQLAAASAPMGGGVPGARPSDTPDPISLPGNPGAPATEASIDAYLDRILQEAAMAGDSGDVPAVPEDGSSEPEPETTGQPDVVEDPAASLPWEEGPQPEEAAPADAPALTNPSDPIPADSTPADPTPAEAAPAESTPEADIEATESESAEPETTPPTESSDAETAGDSDDNSPQ